MSISITRKFDKHNKTVLTAYGVGTRRKPGACISIVSKHGFSGGLQAEMCLSKEEVVSLISELKCLIMETE
mgnify:FL=1